MPKVNHATNGGSHSLADRGLDLYSTPAGAVRALLKAEKIPHGVWEPAAGKNAITDVLREVGHSAIASDIVDHGAPLHFVADFFSQTKMPVGTECILTNPPFQVITEFVEHALDLAPEKLIILARLQFQASDRRSEISRTSGIDAVSRVSWSAAVHAQGRLGGQPRRQQHRFRMVRLGTRIPRPRNLPSAVLRMGTGRARGDPRREPCCQST